MNLCIEIGDQSRIGIKIDKISRGSKMGGTISPTPSLAFPQLPKLEILESYLTITYHSFGTIRPCSYYAFKKFIYLCVCVYLNQTDDMC